MTELPGISELVLALAEFSEIWDCDEISVLYVLNGLSVRLTVREGELVSTEIVEQAGTLP